MNNFKYIAEKNIITITSGVVCIILGIVCIIAWYMGTLNLIQIQISQTPIVPNTALAFLAFGLGLHCLLISYKRLALVFGIMIASIGILTIIEYIFNVQLGIDELFFKSSLPMNMSFPARMSPNTAISFIACGISLSLFSFNTYSRINYYIILLLSSLIFCLSSIALLGYVINLPTTYQWYKFVPMSLHTSIGFLISCAGLAAFIYNKQVLGIVNISNAIPSISFISVLGFTLLLWLAAYHESLNKVQQLTTLESEKIKDIIKDKIEENILDLLGFKTHVNIGPPLSEREWIESAEFYKKTHPWYDAILNLDSNFKVRLQTELDNDISFFVEKNKIMEELFEKFILNKELSISHIINFTPQLKVILIFIPLYKESVLEGFIVGFLNIDYLFKNMLREEAKSGYIVNFYEDNHQIYTNSDALPSQKISVQSDIKLYNINWNFTVRPSIQLLNKETHTFFSYLIIGIGLLIGALLAVVIRFYQISSQLSKELSLMKDMTDALQTCPSLSKAVAIISQYCLLLLPKTSGSLYLCNDTYKKFDLFATWGDTPLIDCSFSVKKCFALRPDIPWYKSGGEFEKLCEHTEQTKFQSDNISYLCIPLFNNDKIMGMLYIRYTYKILNFTSWHPALEETLAKQLTLTLANIQLRDLLKAQATRDPLTNLFNRRYLDESLPRELYQAQRYGHPLSIIMIDIDYFKNINDTYGHKVGDLVLKEIANLLEKKSRRGDIVCRFGGEEFLIVLHEASTHVTQLRAEQLRKEISELHFIWKGKEIKQATVSMGISSFPEHGESEEELILSADKALYLAKESGRNRVEVGKLVVK